MDFAHYRGKGVVVTGCSSGIGQATAEGLVGLGADVVGADVEEPSTVLSSFHAVDLADPTSVAAATAAVGGSVDALVTCAGLIPMAPPWEILKVTSSGPVCSPTACCP